MYKLVLVDDDEALLESFYEFADWNKYNFEVVAQLHNGLEALQYVQSNHVDVIITDIRMPEMDGIELAGRLFKAYPTIKIVFVSAFCDFHYARQAIKYGVVDYISKPVMFGEVEEMLQKIYQNLEDRAENGANGLTESKIVIEREKLFGRLLSSKTLGISNLKKEISNVKILSQSLYSKCAYATFEIIGMEKSLAEKWSGDRERLLDAITDIVCVDTKDWYTVRLSFSENILAVLYVSRGAALLSQKYAQAVTDELWSMYELIAVNETYLVFNSFDAFKAELDAAKTDKLKYLNSKISVQSDEQMLYEAEKYVNEHYAEDINVKKAAVQCHFNEQYFGRQFKKMMGKSFLDFVNEVRVEKAKQRFESGESVERVWNMVGFGSRRTFERQFLYYTKETPEQYRKNKMDKKQ